MKLQWEKKHKAWAITAFLTIASSIIFYMLLDRWHNVSGILGILAGSLQPIIIGLIMAYLLNPLMVVLERRVMFPLMKKAFKKDSGRVKGFARGISIFITWMLALAFVIALFALIFPEMYKSVETLIESIPRYSNNVVATINTLMRKNPQVSAFAANMMSDFSTDFSSVMESAKQWLPNINVMLSHITDSVSAVVTIVFNTLIGIIVSVYVLKDKEKFVEQIKRLFYSVFSLKKANNLIAFCRLTHDKFGNFIIGKIFDSLIIGAICFVGLTLLNIPYASLISVIVGVTNVIPFFGPFIGAVPSALLILLVDPVKCITFILFVIVLQQFDGNVLGPKILGTSTGLSSFWVIFAILVGSGLFGFWGIVCSVPVFAVVYTLVKDGCHYSLRKKGIDYSSETFQRIDHIDEDTKSPVWLKKD